MPGDARSIVYLVISGAHAPEGLPAACTGRRTQLNSDLVRAYAIHRQDAAAVNLLTAERPSPQMVRYDA